MRGRMLLAAVALLAPGCREQGRRFDCDCAYLTDFDDAARRAVTVCAPSPERAPAVARGCAQTGAPAPVQACTCAPPGATCQVGECAARD